MASHEQRILEAYGIAARDLRACYNPDGIVAGRTHFNSYWSRDGFWGVFGALELRDYDQAKRHLELFIKHQRPTGQMPTRIEFLTHTFGHYVGLRQQLAPVFRAAYLAKPVDPTALFVIALWQYYRHTNDRRFLAQNFDAIERAVHWLLHWDKDGDGLLETGFLSDWMDSVIKWGKLLNINVIFYKSLDNFSLICEILGDHLKAHYYNRLAQATQSEIQRQLWNGSYFVDWRRGLKTGNFSADGNVLAIIYEIATKAQSQQVIGYIAGHDLEIRAGLHTSYPAYRWYEIFPTYYLYGIPDYHAKLLWPWVGSLYALAKWRSGNERSAITTLYELAELFLRRDFVAEVYESSGIPVRRLIYQSEIPFAWNAAAYIYAVKSIGLAGRHQVMVK